MAGLFSKIRQPSTSPGGGKSRAPSVKSELDRFRSTLVANDLARSNLFLVRMEKHQSYTLEVPHAPGTSLIGLSEVSNTFTNGLLEGSDVAELTRFLNSEEIERTAYGDVNTNKMGIGNGSIKAELFDPTKTVSMYAEAVTLPSVTAEVRKEHMQYQRKNLLMMTKDHSGLSITFRCSNNYAEYNYLRWLVDQKINNKTNVIDFPDNFIIPQICVYIYNRETNSVATAINNKCLITSISSLEFSYESNNEVAKFTAEFMPEDIKFKTFGATP